MTRATQLVFRFDAVLDGALGVFLLLSPLLDGLFRLLDLPNPQPSIFTQIGGGFLLSIAYLLWYAPSNPALARPVALSISLANGLGVLVVAGWLLSGRSGVGALGTVNLAIAAVMLAIFGVFKFRYAVRGKVE